MATNFTRTSIQPQGLRFVDISDKPVEAEVLRNGAKVGRVEIREDLISDFVAPERLDDRFSEPRIVFQSVKAGERVARGTVVDVVLAGRYLVRADFVKGSHATLADRSVGEVGDLFLSSAAVEAALRRAEKPEDLSPKIRTAIETTATQNNIPVTTTVENSDFTALFTTIKAAQTFK